MSGSGTQTGARRSAKDLTARRVRSAGHDAAQSTALRLVGRFGLICRGVLYGLIGFLALQIAFGRSGEEADSTGALRAVSGTPVGTAVLWLLAVGFAGLAGWQLAEACFARGVETKDRLVAVGRVVIYAALCVSTVLFIVGEGSQSSSDQKSQGASARAMEHPSGRILVAAVAVAFVIAGIVFVVRGLRRSFLENLDLDAASPATRQVIEGLGLTGNVARGVAFGAIGVFGVQAAVTYDPEKAKGLDGALRAFADAPFGRWLLVVVALGLMVFGVYSCCQAWYQRTHAAAST
jgi:Domain of Unknown Function (DUF1206)